MNLNTLVGKETGNIYYACHKKCELCKEWKKPGNRWKHMIYFPYHCPGCNFAGYPEDFDIFGNTFMCLDCKKKCIKQIKKIIRPHSK